MKGNLVFAVDPATADYQLMMYNRESTDKEEVLHGPVAQGTFRTHNGYHQMVYVGEDRLMDVDPATGNYFVLRCDRTHYGASIPLPCDSIGRGNILKSKTCNYTSCSEFCRQQLWMVHHNRNVPSR